MLPAVTAFLGPGDRVTNWPACEAGLRRRGDLTLWLDPAASAGWAAPRRSTPGAQQRYSDLAIELVLTLRLVFQLALRQAEAFSQSVLTLLGLELQVPGPLHPVTPWKGLCQTATACPGERRSGA